jgi:hypothetical protein
MYNVFRNVRDERNLVHRVQLNKSPMHKTAALQFAKRIAKKFNISFDNGTWRNYHSTMSPFGDTVEINPLET